MGIQAVTASFRRKNSSLDLFLPLLFLFKSPHLAKNMPDIFYFLNFFLLFQSADHYCFNRLFVCTIKNLWLMGPVWVEKFFSGSFPTLAILFSSLFTLPKILRNLSSFFSWCFFYLQTIIVLTDWMFAQLRSCGWWESGQLPPGLEEKNTSLNFFLSLFPHLTKNMPNIFYFWNFFLLFLTGRPLLQTMFLRCFSTK
jgi:hypothetical protein